MRIDLDHPVRDSEFGPVLGAAQPGLFDAALSQYPSLVGTEPFERVHSVG